jgi:hypothetical protein
MSKQRRKSKFSNFKIKALQAYKVIPEYANDDTTFFANLSDPRLTRVDGGRRRPIFYDDGIRPTFEPK